MGGSLYVRVSLLWFRRDFFREAFFSRSLFDGQEPIAHRSKSLEEYNNVPLLLYLYDYIIGSPLSEIDSVTHASVGFRHWSHRDIWIQIGRDLPILRQEHHDHDTGRGFSSWHPWSTSRKTSMIRSSTLDLELGWYLSILLRTMVIVINNDLSTIVGGQLVFPWKLFHPEKKQVYFFLQAPFYNHHHHHNHHEFFHLLGIEARGHSTLRSCCCDPIIVWRSCAWSSLNEY